MTQPCTMCGAFMVVTAPERIITGEDLSRCYAPPPIEQPCDRVVYKTGTLNAAFTALFGGLLLVGAASFMWELWSAVDSKPITDDVLKLLNDSFGRNWRDPRTWPWSRLFYAYGFTLLSATSIAIVGMMMWTLVGSSHPGKRPTASVGTPQTFRVSP